MFGKKIYLCAVPKIYEYLGIIFFFYANEHSPLHVHARMGEYESKIEFEYLNGKISNILFKKVRGRTEIPFAKRKDIKKFILKYHNGIVEKWIAFFVMNKKTKTEKITKKI